MRIAEITPTKIRTTTLPSPARLKHWDWYALGE
jgi:hypothetical protein